MKSHTVPFHKEEDSGHKNGFDPESLDEHLDVLESLREAARPVVEMTADQRAVAGIVAILMSADNPGQVLTVARCYHKILKGVLVLSPEGTDHQSSDHISGSRATRASSKHE